MTSNVSKERVDYLIKIVEGSSPGGLFMTEDEENDLSNILIEKAKSFDTPAPPAPTAEQVEAALNTISFCRSNYITPGEWDAAIATVRAAVNRTVTRDCLVPYIVYFHLDDEVLGQHVTEEPKFRWVERMAHDATEALADFRKSLNSKNWVIDEVVPKEPR